jgi:glycosyltransferase involved in cell wall biosynthesis
MIKTWKRILMGCYGVPGYGGANIASYELLKMMLGHGLDASYLNIINKHNEKYFKYFLGENYDNPCGLDNVYKCVLNEPIYGNQSELTELINKLAPDLMVGIGYPAAFLLKRASTQKPLIFLTSGCGQVKESIVNKREKDAISMTETINRTNIIPTILDKIEKKTVEISDLIITHSDMIKNFFLYFYYSHLGKIYSDVIWFGDWMYKYALNYTELKKPFAERGIDVVFFASSWTRAEENFNLAKKIVSRLEGLNIYIVGEVEKKLSNVKHHGLIPRQEDLFALLGNTKTVICPALFDPAPVVLFEASALGCNIVASKNCSNWQICNEKLLVDPYNLNNFIEKIYVSLKNKFEDNMEFFIKTNSFNNFIDVVSVF